MRHGMEVSPVMYETEDGQEYVGDFQADYHGGHGAEIDTSAFATTTMRTQTFGKTQT